MTGQPATVPVFQHANAHFVSERLLVGGDLDPDPAHALEQVDELTRLGRVTHVLDVRYEADDERLWAETGIGYRWDGIDDAGQVVPVEWFDGVVTWALEVLEDPRHRLLAHCHMGINRGPSAGYAVLLGLGWDPVTAIDTIRRARPIANVWYAEDALRWHHWRTGASRRTRHHDRARLSRWRAEHPLDVVRIIREVRETEHR